MERLRRSIVVVVGLGAVGSYAVEALARAGVGRLKLIDRATLKPSNINRQLFALESTLGRPKAEVAAARVRDVNPACEVEALVLDVDAATAPSVVDGSPDLLLDAIDHVEAKVALLAAAERARVPHILSSMGAATRVDPHLVRVGRLPETTHCPLARQVKRRMEALGLGSTVFCVYSVEAARNKFMSSRIDQGSGRAGSLTPMGSMPTLPGIFGLVAANEAILALAGRESPQRAAIRGRPGVRAARREARKRAT